MEAKSVRGRDTRNQLINVAIRNTGILSTPWWTLLNPLQPLILPSFFPSLFGCFLSTFFSFSGLRFSPQSSFFQVFLQSLYSLIPAECYSAFAFPSVFTFIKLLFVLFFLYISLSVLLFCLLLNTAYCYYVCLFSVFCLTLLLTLLLLTLFSFLCYSTFQQNILLGFVVFLLWYLLQLLLSTLYSLLSSHNFYWLTISPSPLCHSFAPFLFIVWFFLIFLIKIYFNFYFLSTKFIQF